MGIEIVAEIGINHNGSMALAQSMIWRAKECGADVAKFQIYDPEWLLDQNHPDLRDHWDIILKTKLTRDQVIMLKKECDRAGIEFLASVFRPEIVEWTEAIGMKRYKIASRSIYDKPLAEAIIATGKPVILSYGMSKAGQIPAIFDCGISSSLVTNLYCISKYPTKLEDLLFIDRMGSVFDDYGMDGFSDHTEGITASVTAMSLGAKVIEKHVTYDKTFDGPDHASSITFNELRQLCNMRDEIEKVLYKEKL